MYKKKLLSFLVLTCLSLGMLAVVGNISVTNVGASADNTNNIGTTILGEEFDTVTSAVYNETNTPTVGIQNYVAAVINAFLGLLGVIFLVLIIYAGFLWMTAGGNDDQVRKAKQLLTNSIIGIVIIVAAYAISYFVINAVTSIDVTT